MATTAIQAMETERSPASEDIESNTNVPRRLGSEMLNTCYTYTQDSEFVKKYFPEEYRPVKGSN